MKHWAVSLVWLVVLGGAALAALAEQFDGLSDDERFTVLTTRSEDQDLESAREAQLQRFAELWSDDDYGAGLAAADDEAVRLRLRAADWILRSPAAPAWVAARYRSVLAEASGRGLTRNSHYRQLFDWHLLRMDMDSARGIKAAFPEAGLPAVPELIAPEFEPGPDETVVWKASDGRVTGRVVSPHELRPGVIVEASAGCSFARRAAEDLARDELLAPVVTSHSLWLLGPGSAGSFQRLASWNAEFPDTPIFYAPDVQAWPDQRFYSTPRFVFMDESGLATEMLGWHGGAESLAEFAGQLVRIGLLDADALTEDVFAYADEPEDRHTCAARAPALRTIFEQAPIATPAQLEAHLADAAATGESPLFLLTEQGRQRLIDSLHFRDGSAPSFRIDDLLELRPEERYELATLFGNQHFFAGTFFPVDLLSEQERDLADRVNCVGDYAHDNQASRD